MAGKWTKSVTFRAGSVTVTFVPVANMPGYSHRVLISAENRELRDWLGVEFKPCPKVADFFCKKHNVIA